MPAPACGTGVGAALAGAGTRQCRTPWEAPSSGREGGRGGKPRPLAPDGRQVQGMTRVRSGLGSGHRRARPSRSCVADSCHRHSDSEESRSGVAPGMHSTRKITAITEERAGIRPRRAPSAVSVDAGVPPGASPGSPLPARRRGPDTTRRSPRWSEEADWGGCFAPPARLGGGVTVEGGVVAITAGRNHRDVRGAGEHLIGPPELHRVRRAARLVDGVLAPSWNRTVVWCVFPSRARPAGDVRGPRRSILVSGLGGLVRYVRIGGGRCGITAGPAT